MQMGDLALKEILELLEMQDSKLTRKEQNFLVESTNNLIKRNGLDWMKRHKGLLLDQWEQVLDIGIP